MDTDISHAVEERLLAIETRLDQLEGSSGSTKPAPDDEGEVNNELPETPAGAQPKDEELYVVEEES